MHTCPALHFIPQSYLSTRACPGPSWKHHCLYLLPYLACKLQTAILGYILSLPDVVFGEFSLYAYGGSVGGKAYRRHAGPVSEPGEGLGKLE